jgi:hypothetical protein
VKANFQGHVCLFKVPLNSHCRDLRAVIFLNFGFPDDRARIIWSGSRFGEFHNSTLDKAELKDGSTIDIFWERVGGLFPGICLWSPTPRLVDVHLKLSPCWWRVETVHPCAAETRTP